MLCFYFQHVRRFVYAAMYIVRFPVCRSVFFVANFWGFVYAVMYIVRISMCRSVFCGSTFLEIGIKVPVPFLWFPVMFIIFPSVYVYKKSGPN